MHVFDSYHSRWFPALQLSLAGVAILAWTAGFGAPGGIPGGAFGLAAAVAVLLVLLAGGTRAARPASDAGEVPETGDLIREWLAGLAAAVLLLPLPPEIGVPGALAVLIRSASGLVFRWAPIRLEVDRRRTNLDRIAWAPLIVGLIAGSTMMVRGTASAPAAAAAAWFGAGLRALFAVDEGRRRLVGLGRLVPRGERRGLLRSFVIYYRLPFRRVRLRRFYRGLAPSGGLIWDVGSHLGNRCRAALDNGMSVRAFEPQPACVSLLENWYGRHPRFSLRPAAVGDHSGTVVLRLSTAHPTLSSVSEDWVDRMGQDDLFAGIRWDRPIRVPMIRLDSEAADPPPDFVKIDVEGAEEQVLRGLGPLPPALAFEYLPSDIRTAAACVRLLESRARWEWNVVEGERFRYTFDRPQAASAILDFLGAVNRSDPSGDVYARRIGVRSR